MIGIVLCFITQCEFMSVFWSVPVCVCSIFSSSSITVAVQNYEIAAVYSQKHPRWKGYQILQIIIFNLLFTVNFNLQVSIQGQISYPDAAALNRVLSQKLFSNHNGLQIYYFNFTLCTNVM